MRHTIGRLGLALAVAVGTLALPGCGSEPTGATDFHIEGVIEGVIERVSTSDLKALVHVTEASTGGTRVLRISPDTRIRRATSGGDVVAAERTALVVGARVRALHTGVELRSDPPQYEATAVLIVAQPAEE